MNHVRRLRLLLPARFAPIARQAAQELAERMVDTTYDQSVGAMGPLRLTDRGQSAAQLGLEAGQAAARISKGSEGS